jgi:hypothetical protein
MYANTKNQKNNFTHFQKRYFLFKHLYTICLLFVYYILYIVLILCFLVFTLKSQKSYFSYKILSSCQISDNLDTSKCCRDSGEFSYSASLRKLSTQLSCKNKYIKNASWVGIGTFYRWVILSHLYHQVFKTTTWYLDQGIHSNLLTALLTGEWLTTLHQVSSATVTALNLKTLVRCYHLNKDIVTIEDISTHAVAFGTSNVWHIIS